MMMELQAWLKSCDEANAAMKDFSKYHFIEEPCDGEENFFLESRERKREDT